MLTVNYPTARDIPGPWLISSEQLIGLDKLIDGFSERLAAEKEREIQQSAEAKVVEFVQKYPDADEREIQETRTRYSNYYRDRFLDRRKVSFFLPRGKTVTDEKFSTAITHPHMTEAPIGFSLFHRVGEIKAQVELRNLSWSHDLELKVEPSDSEIVQEMFGALQNWAADLSSPRWLQLLRKWRGGIGLCLIVWLLMGVFSGFIYFVDSPKMAFEEEAHELLKKGITAQDQQHAIELLLAINSEYYPAEKRSSPTARFWAIFLIGALVLASLTTTPSVVIGVWGGKASMRLWRWWIRFIGITVPTLVFTTIIWKWLLSTLK